MGRRGVYQWALLLLSAAASLRADGAEAFLERLYAKMAASFSAEQALGGGGEVLILANPGFALTDASLQDAFEISRLADQIPLPTRNYQPSGSTASSTYQTLLSQAEVTNYQDMASRYAALQARRTLYDPQRPGHPTAAYAAYLKSQAAYLSALDALNVARAEAKATGKAAPIGLAEAAGAQAKAWQTLGNRKLIEDAQATLQTYYDSNVKARFATQLGEMASAARTDGHGEIWYPVLATPPPEEWLLDRDWMPFRLTLAEKTLAGVQPRLPLGAQPASGVLPVGLSLVVETKRVGLCRPWMDPAVFLSRGWRFPAGSGFPAVSTGNPSDAAPGLMPLLVTGVLLSRKLVIQGWEEGMKDFKALGPFALGSSPRSTREGGRLTLAVAGPQIIGFFCTPVPKAPNPDAKAFRSP